MKKDNYMKPARRTVKLQHRMQILAGSYKSIETKNGSDNDDPVYDKNSIGNIWDAN